MTKSLLRQAYKAKRQAFSAQEREMMSCQVFEQLKKMEIWDKTYFHVFMPIQKQLEIDTSYIINHLKLLQKKIVVPVSDFETRTMKNALLTENTIFQTNKYGISEPLFFEEIETDCLEIVFIPMLISDQKGNRVGYGKGFYDNFLATCNPNVLKIGLNYFEPIHLIEDTNPKDVKLDKLVTPKSNFRF